MKLTKFEHACLDIKEGSDRLIIDPGAFATPSDLSRVTAVVITHAHFDHFINNKLQALAKQNPGLKIFTTQEVADEYKGDVVVPHVNKPYNAGGFKLEFFGTDHARNDPEVSAGQNIGVLVNDHLYYPGDSYTLCPKPFKALAIPASGPWFKIAETIPLIEESNCEMVFPTHDALLTELGKDVGNRYMSVFAERSGKKYQAIKDGDSLTI
jgi:L-ascorbate metabolism protein UlaG (beta-lactamase superfamily)